jgi:hypothetical protein
MSEQLVKHITGIEPRIDANGSVFMITDNGSIVEGIDSIVVSTVMDSGILKNTITLTISDYQGKIEPCEE